MRLLLDTHVLVWLSGALDQMREETQRSISRADKVFVSVVSAWEIAIKTGLGQLRYPVESLESQIADMGFETLDIRMDHALAAGALPRHHRDPFDRMLVAQARLEGLTVVTADRQIGRYEVSILKA